MPALARKLLVCAAVDGIIIQPLGAKGQQRAPSPARIRYGEATVSSIPRDQIPEDSTSNSSFEALGIIGLFTVSRLSYLITITGRQQVAQVRGFPVYVVTDVALTPCTSQKDAEAAIAHTATQLRRASADKLVAEDETDTESELDVPVGKATVADDPDPHSEGETSKPGDDNDSSTEAAGGARSSIAEDVIKNRGGYGRFAQRWFSGKGWVMDQKRNLGLSSVAGNAASKGNAKSGSNCNDDDVNDDKNNKKQHKVTTDDKALSEAVVQEKVDPPPSPSTGESLIPKLLRMAHIWFGTSKSFYFCYDLDITSSVAGRSATTAATEQALYKIVDPMFFWNQKMLKPFLGISEDSLVLPIMQGFVGQRSFVVDRNPPQNDSQEESVEMKDLSPPPEMEDAPPLPAERTSMDLGPSEKKFLITVISRRSIKRAGLRYLRRGVDEEGYAANSVETEQILSTTAWDSSSKIFSFVQVRGSIPLFFTQSPYSLKPMPVLQHSAEANFRAFKNHFDRMSKKYGSVELVNLVEKHGVESIIGNEYEKNVVEYNEGRKEGDTSLDFEWFDFHSACRGMKFENVSLLLDTLGEKIEKMGSTVEGGDGVVSQRQSGILRTNCMDCLDRTNVCQSSFGKFMLEHQLKEEGFDLSAQADQENSWFNTLWADNGDAISKQYASTAAMKGDYTRTRKRDYRGMVNDLGLSLTRFYNGMVNDHFSQAAIDFFLGNVTSLVFDEFEATMMTKDPGVSMSKMRELAIETSQKIAIEDEKEDFIHGWTLLSPHMSDTIKSLPFEEVVLLLTDAALYLCRFDWKLDKVSSFERVDLGHVIGIKVGTYVTSTISPAQSNEDKNVGIVITFEPGKTDVKRTNTRSLSSISGQSGDSSGKAAGGDGGNASASGVLDGPAPAPAAASGVLNQGILSALAGKQQALPPRKIALKALYSQTAISDAKGVQTMTEKEQIDMIAGEIERQVFACQPKRKQGDEESMVEKGDIISLADAKRSTGLFEQWGHTIKKLVWA